MEGHHFHFHTIEILVTLMTLKSNLFGLFARLFQIFLRFFERNQVFLLQFSRV